MNRQTTDWMNIYNTHKQKRTHSAYIKIPTNKLLKGETLQKNTKGQ